MKVHWTDRAKWRLRLIEQEIAEHNPTAAKTITARILKRSGQIGHFPQSGRRTPEYDRDDIREMLERPYRIIYRIKTDIEQADVVAVMHYRQVLPGDVEAL